MPNEETLIFVLAEILTIPDGVMVGGAFRGETLKPSALTKHSAAFETIEIRSSEHRKSVPGKDAKLMKSLSGGINV
jgi:hypothetical protein